MTARLNAQPPPSAARLPLARQKALVTGANSGIGRAVALALAAAGADVVVNFVSGEHAAEDVATEIRALGRLAIPHLADVSVEDEVRAMFERAISEFGTLDIVVNNAGIQRDAPFEHMTLDDWRAVLDVNLTGQFLCAREAVREFKRRGVVEDVSVAAGKIIAISSVHDVIPWAGHVNYAASKAGAAMMTKSIAQEVAADHIRVNAIAPGAIKTNINEKAWDSPRALANLLELIPYGRIGTPDDVANAAVWLASDASDYVHGATLFIDGGMTLYPGFETGG